MNNIKLEILEYNYWEHFNHVKNISLVLPINHLRRKLIEKELNILSDEIKKIKNGK